MKKFFFIMALLLTACGSQSPLTCEEEQDRHLEWSGISYTMPACWLKNETPNALVLTNEDKKKQITMTLDASQLTNLKSEDGEDTSLVNEKGQTVYITNSDKSHEEAHGIFASLEVTLLNVAGNSDCSPDYDYPQSLTQYWNGYQFSLPWCWSAKEAEDRSVHMTPGDNVNGEVEVNFDPNMDFSTYTRGADLTIGDSLYRVYTNEEGASILRLYDSFGITVTSLDDPDVQLILSSLNFF